jgi:hypothetical protein
VNVFAAALLLIVPGYLPALALTRSRWGSVLTAGVVCVITAGVAGIACVLLRISVIPCSLVLFAAVNAGSVLLLRRWQRAASPPPPPTAGSDSIAMLLFALCALALVVAAPEPTAWDARSIWWFHAAWFEAGGDVVVDALRNPIMPFAHPDYPNGVPAFVGTVWALFGGENLRLAMEITAVLTAMAVALLVATVFDRARIDSASVVVPILLGVAVVMQGEGLAAAGYLDVLCGSLTTLACVGFIRDRSASLVSAAALAGATLAKAEGLYFVIGLALVAGVWVERRGRYALTVGAAMIPAVVWLVTVRALNADLATDVQPSGFVRLLLLDGGHWDRARDAAPRILREMWPYLVTAAGAAIGLGAAPQRVSRRGFTLAVGCVLASALTTAGVVAVYAAGLPPVDWWLDTSLQRVLVTPRIFSLVAIAVAVHELGAFDGVSPGVRAGTREIDEVSAGGTSEAEADPRIPG